MVNFCAIFRCSSRGDRDKKSFYRLPAVITRQGEKTMELSKKRREKWLTRISRDIKASNLAYTRVCSDHFISGKPCSIQYADNPDWAPSLKLGHDKVSESLTARDSSRYRRLVGRVEQVKHIDAASALDSLQGAAHEDGGTVTEDDTERGSQTDLHGDVVLADRGFDIADSIGIMGATLHIPAFTKGKKQLTSDEVETTRRIANVRIHVERVIGCLRQKYQILQSTLS
ncbi:hypothetical protein ScPMuIL_008083 [Solemya velum]